MNALELWIHSPGAKALGWTLFHFLWEGALIAGILVLALAALKHASARARYTAACAALLGMAAAFGITQALEYPWATPRLTLLAAPLTGATLTGGLVSDSASRSGIPWKEILAWAPALWLAGVFALFLYRVGSWMAAQRLRRMGTCAAPEAWTHRLTELSATMRVSRPVALMESCLAEVPIMIGYLKPAIVMPLGLLTGLPQEQVEAILLHELAHIRRADYLINLLQTGIEGILFYHPAVWWVSNVVRAERENCCDDAVVALQGNAHQYAAALFTVEQSRGRLPQAALAATGGSLAKRIRRLLGKPDARDLSLPVIPSALLLISMAVALVAWQPVQPRRAVAVVAAQAAAPAVEATPAQPAVAALEKDSVAADEPQDAAKPQPAVQTQTPPARGVSYTVSIGSDYVVPPEDISQWRRDVIFIITPEESAAFDRLHTQEEQQQFITQFWERRNPTPGSATNAARDEYYRRLAYADAHFGLTVGDHTTPGRTTAMGGSYVRYGPPDQIEDHTSDPQNPSQTWRYNYLEAFHNRAELQFTKVGNTYRQHINWPPPLATVEGVGAAADDLASAISREKGQAAPKSTTSGLPGRQASIQISALKDGVTLSVPLDSLSGRVDFIGQIRSLSAVATSPTGEPILVAANVRDYMDVTTGGTWESHFTLQSGSYVCKLLVRENTTGRIFTEQINFVVN